MDQVEDDSVDKVHGQDDPHKFESQCPVNDQGTDKHEWCCDIQKRLVYLLKNKYFCDFS